MGVIFWGSSRTTADIPPSLPHPLGHFGEYFILGFLLFLALSRVVPRSFATTFGMTIGISLLYAISDEIHQLFTPTRSCSFLDILVDMAAILCLFALLAALRKAGDKGRRTYNLLAGR